MPKRLIEVKLGDLVPDGAVLVHKKQIKGQYLGERVVGHWGIFPFDGKTYERQWEAIDVYVYEVPE